VRNAASFPRGENELLSKYFDVLLVIRDHLNANWTLIPQVAHACMDDIPEIDEFCAQITLSDHREDKESFRKACNRNNVDSICYARMKECIETEIEAEREIPSEVRYFFQYTFFRISLLYFHRTLAQRRILTCILRILQLREILLIGEKKWARAWEDS